MHILMKIYEENLESYFDEKNQIYVKEYKIND
jgi:hypothetical protein